jgi:hypothetical protein
MAGPRGCGEDGIVERIKGWEIPASDDAYLVSGGVEGIRLLDETGVARGMGRSD